MYLMWYQDKKSMKITFYLISHKNSCHTMKIKQWFIATLKKSDVHICFYAETILKLF